MAVNYLMASSDDRQLPHGQFSSDDGDDDGQLPHGFVTVNYFIVSSESDDGSITSWLLVMTVNYIMASSDDGQLPHGF